MPDNNKTPKQTDGQNQNKPVRRTSGVTVTGRGLKRVENLPTEREVEKSRRRQREEAEWNRGIVRVKTGADRILIVLILLLLTLGTVMVFSASYPLSLYLTEGRTSLLFIQRQVTFALLGIGVMAGISFIPYNWFRRLAPIAYAVGLGLLVLALFIGNSGDAASDSGVKRWIGIQGTSFNIQPSELMKPALVMMLAWYMDKYREKIIDRTDRKTYLISGVIVPMLIMGLACICVIAGKHLSGTLIVGMIGVCVIFLGGAHFGYMALMGLSAGGGVMGLYVATNEYARKRLTTFADENADVLSDKWQTNQGIYAIGNGGFLGTGLGGSVQKFSYVSDAHTDFIFTIWCEEMGFVGALLLIGLFLAFIWRGFTVAMHAPDTFSSLLAAGIVIQVGLQVFLNLGVVTDLIPNTGVPLPFFTYGGSSLLVLMAEMGILLSISRHSYQKR